MKQAFANKNTVSQELKESVLHLLKQLIATPSFSGGENGTAELIGDFFRSRDISFSRAGNNILAQNKYYDPLKPVILLNSHHDTVKPNPAYTRNPFEATQEDGKIFGLGSNDAGGALVSLIAVFVHFYPQENMLYNLVLAATAEEENSGPNGIESVLGEIGPVDFAIVGEPTQMHLAIAEKGLLVLDCTSTGKAGHAAREEGINAIYKALQDIEWFHSFKFPEESELLGPVKMSVTMIQAGSQHNVVPADCRFTVDIRVNELYTHEEILDIAGRNVGCEIKPRSLRMRSSSIAADHPIVEAGKKIGRKCYGSPTTSDQALIPCPSLKIGPGDSARSHSADEFIYVSEIGEGIDLYTQMLEQVMIPQN
ncbi:MAG: peptidase M20 [Bacteroidetes bacterium]|nr:MAG: peptidase M20 [Bacteroidota bacterium]